jgi:hypothetical protein
MDETKGKHSGFLGTYFNRDSVMRLSALSRTFAWVVLIIYTLEWIAAIGISVLQILRGFWAGMGFTDYVQNFLMLLEQPLRGVVYFIVLQAVANVLLIYLDMEDNARRAARNAGPQK